MYKTQIEYSREDRDYALWLDGEFIGCARTKNEAEATLREEVYKRMRLDNRDLTPTAQLHSLYMIDEPAFQQRIDQMTIEEREEQAVLYALYLTNVKNNPRTPEQVLFQWRVYGTLLRLKTN